MREIEDDEECVCGHTYAEHEHLDNLECDICECPEFELWDDEDEEDEF